MSDLNGKLCLITGATSGLGRAIALALGARGNRPYLGYVNWVFDLDPSTRRPYFLNHEP